MYSSLTAILGAMASKRARQVKAGAKAAAEIADKTGRVSGNSSVASKGVNMYNGPTIDRPFEKDFPNGYKADKDGNLTHDIDGRQLVPGGTTVGRVVRGEEKTLSATELDAIAEEATGRPVTILPQSELGHNLGRTRMNRVTGRPIDVALSDKLTIEQGPKVLGHEVGHVIDQYAGEIPTKGLKRELGDLYNTLNHPNRDRQNPDLPATYGKPVSPKTFGYRKDDVDRELMAEAIRVYMVNPSYIKEHAPNVAARIRKWVNENPELRKIVQFNSAAGAAALGAGQSSDDE